MNCCFIGHRTVNAKKDLTNKIYETVKNLLNSCVDTFIFGSKSQFNDLCLEIITEFKAQFPYIVRIYVRGEYEHINDDYEAYLLESFEKTYFPEKAKNSGRMIYIMRNEEMVDRSDV